jgi:UDP-glucose 4-epimerase
MLAAEGHRVLVVDDLRHACGESLPAQVDLQVMELASPALSGVVTAFRPDAVLHLAAQGGVSRSVRDPAGDAMVNVVGTIAVLKAATDAGCRRFVFASSGGAIYGTAPSLPTTERARPRPLSPYGAAKLAAEGYLDTFARSYGLSTLALRYANVYGPFQDGSGEAGVVAITCERLLSGFPPEIRGDGLQTRDFVYVEDVAQANLDALGHRVDGVMNIGTGLATSIRNVVDRLAVLAEYAGAIRYVEGRAGEVRHTALDAGRAKRRLGWSAHTSLHDGLRQTFTSFRQRQPTAPASGGPAGAGARPGPGWRGGSE